MKLPKPLANASLKDHTKQLLASDGISPSDGPCQRACTAAYGVCVRRCNFLPHPAARAVCYGGCTAAYGACLASC